MNLIEMLEEIKKQLPESEVVDFVTSSERKPFTALKDNDAITFTSTGGNPIHVKWPEFQQIISLLISNPEGVLAGNAMNPDEGVGKGNCKLDTIEGQISHYVYGRSIGENPMTRRHTYIMPVLIKAGIVTIEKVNRRTKFKLI